MKLFYLLTLLPCCVLHANAQQLDSIKYTNGYLYYHTYGQGEPVIVLSGGPGNSCLQQEEVAIELGKHYKSILPEQRGTGLSIPVPMDSTTINMQSALDDLNRLMNHLDLKQVVIYGHSWGAMLAMSFAAKYPEKVKSLVLASPGYYKFDPDFFTTHVNNLRGKLGVSDLALMDSLEKKMEAGKAGAADSAQYNRTVRLAYVYNKTIIDSLLAKIYVAKPNTTMQQLMVSDLIRIHYDLSKTLYHYTGPIQVIAGRQDPLSFYTYELKIIRPDIVLHWVQASGHFPMFEQQQDFYKQLNMVMQALIKHP
ncbi:pimeloyl-ACP methyl ester carboxylesterase [Chitinophaga niastensis]|uniref:Pimeloyl-ACP methyl ester carboxylesterase n=1 Tax=Chitinophaga niastensis TaxID=536980 RepID=A0A2P8HK21_CHINA|nr:alpha/beta hydrolase [Chitinophaga niastensis]PSL46520.1 pimeloyl-ACP methyl ester carboxylesterase [Chitinophaga niastensis]